MWLMRKQKDSTHKCHSERCRSSPTELNTTWPGTKVTNCHLAETINKPEVKRNGENSRNLLANTTSIF